MALRYDVHFMDDQRLETLSRFNKFSSFYGKKKVF
jgi:hypothetical protein